MLEENVVAFQVILLNGDLFAFFPGGSVLELEFVLTSILGNDALDGPDLIACTLLATAESICVKSTLTFFLGAVLMHDTKVILPELTHL